VPIEEEEDKQRKDNFFFFGTKEMCHKIRAWHFPVHGYRTIYEGNLKLNAEHQSLPHFTANLE
jgi:hypothetical protein